MRLLILFASFFILGCGQGFESIGVPFVDPTIQPYVDRYEQYKIKFASVGGVRPISIYFKTLPGSFIGMCYIKSSGERVIEIDPDFWFSNTDIDREILILHEMGHCDLNRDHVENSIMEPNHISPSRYLSQQFLFLQELFTNFTNLLFSKSQKGDIVYPCNHNHIGRNK